MTSFSTRTPHQVYILSATPRTLEFDTALSLNQGAFVQFPVAVSQHTVPFGACSTVSKFAPGSSQTIFVGLRSHAFDTYMQLHGNVSSGLGRLGMGVLLEKRLWWANRNEVAVNDLC